MNATTRRIDALAREARRASRRATSHSEYSAAKRRETGMKRWRSYATGGYGSTYREPEPSGTRDLAKPRSERTYS